MDATEVTNAQFKKFVEATGYITMAEKAPDWEELKKQLPAGTIKPHDSLLVAASLVFALLPHPFRYKMLNGGVGKRNKLEATPAPWQYY